MMSIADLRREYASRALDEASASADPLAQFSTWFAEAEASDLLDVNAMTLATVTPAGDPAARIVLLKDFGPEGFVFFTNYESAKGHDLAAHPRACLLAYWAPLERQVRVTGAVERVSDEDSTAYFHSRPVESQIGAWASQQSTPVEHRGVLEDRFRALQAQYEGTTVPRPHYWGGYRVVPERIEFWQGRPSRLHDRLLYERGASGEWSRTRLAP
ncbi:MAG: pyridoxamine 5'-phosphate oxidase [Vicinamibacterales bacterium]